MAFDGIPLAALDFYEDLEADNSKAFWTANKQRYEEHVRAPLKALSAELEREFGPGKLFRPYRDVRFSKDKTPYKTNQGVWFDDSHMYVHISAAGLFVGGGYWSTSSGQVARLRRAVADDVSGPALERALAHATKAKFEIGGEQLIRVPSGYDRGHPRADLLRRKQLTAGRDLGFPAWLATVRAKKEVVSAGRSIRPLVEWLDTHVGHD